MPDEGKQPHEDPEMSSISDILRALNIHFNKEEKFHPSSIMILFFFSLLIALTLISDKFTIVSKDNL
jgi:hypothetical protein